MTAQHLLGYSLEFSGILRMSVQLRLKLTRAVLWCALRWMCYFNPWKRIDSKGVCNDTLIIDPFLWLQWGNYCMSILRASLLNQKKRAVSWFFKSILNLIKLSRYDIGWSKPIFLSLSDRRSKSWYQKSFPNFEFSLKLVKRRDVQRWGYMMVQNLIGAIKFFFPF